MSTTESCISIEYLNKNGVNYKIGKTKEAAGKRTQICCKDNAVIWKGTPKIFV